MKGKLVLQMALIALIAMSFFLFLWWASPVGGLFSFTREKEFLVEESVVLSSPTSLPRPDSLVVVIRIPEIKGYDCFFTEAVFEYEENEEIWVDFTRPSIEEEGLMIPWVISVKKDSLRGDVSEISEVRSFCVRVEEVPDYGRGPNLVSEVLIFD
jgi:hypothetical protein